MSCSTDRPAQVDNLCHAATHCKVCFEQGLAKPATIDIPQPRWIGKDYWTSNPRVCVVMLNPGAGDRNQITNNKMKTLLYAFRANHKTLDEIFDYQHADFKNWGRPGKQFLPFFENFFVDGIDHIAFVNLAWCATEKNNYPSPILKNCTTLHTLPLLTEIKPNILFLSGRKTSIYKKLFQNKLPHCNIFETLHYAHRKQPKINIEKNESDRFRTFLQSIEGF